MAQNLSNSEENRLLDLSLANTEVALLTASPGEAGSLTSEVTGGSYARVTPTWAAAASGSKSPSADVVFPQATAIWGLIAHVALVAKTGQPDAGAVRWYGALTASKQIDSGDTFTLPLAQVAASLD